MPEYTCRECDRPFSLKREPREVRKALKCPRCRRAITRVRRQVNRKEYEDRVAADRRREILRPRTRSLQWLFEGAAGAMCVQPTAGVPSMGDTIYRVEGVAGIHFLMPESDIDADTLYLTKWVEAWKRLIRMVTPRGTRKA